MLKAEGGEIQASMCFFSSFFIHFCNSILPNVSVFLQEEDEEEEEVEQRKEERRIERIEPVGRADSSLERSPVLSIE